MSSIDKQAVQAVSDLKAGYTLGNADVAILNELARIALASLEAEERADPVAFINGAWTLVYYRPPKELGLKIGDNLYTAPPAPVSVPDAYIRDERGRMMLNGKPEPRIGYGGGWNACRAAMLQGADGNSPVIPDGWVPCSERMPSVGEKVLAYRPDAPESNDPLIKMAKYVGKSAHGHGFDCYCKPSHWMPLPAAPQQEVK